MELTANQQLTLFEEAQRGNRKSREKLYYSHLRMAQKFSHLYRGTAPGEDLVAVAMASLTKSERGFKPSKGAKFSTYAYFWMRNDVSRFAKKELRTRNIQRPILPVATKGDMEELDAELLESTLDKALSKLPKLNRDALKLRFGLGGKECTLAEIGAKLGVKKTAVRGLITASIEALRGDKEAMELLKDLL
jgi:RNA polymerase sigma factor (sigma-70 family)